MAILIVAVFPSRLSRYKAKTHDGRKLRLMTLIDEFTCECLAIKVAPA